MGQAVGIGPRPMTPRVELRTDQYGRQRRADDLAGDQVAGLAGRSRGGEGATAASTSASCREVAAVRWSM
jgi:hypothetical protein